MMEVRTASLNDLNAIESLWKEMLLFHIALDDYFVMIPEAEAIHREYMKSILLEESERVLVADDGGVILGYIVMEVGKKPPIYPHEEYVEIAALSVCESARRKGVGRQLVEAVLTWGRGRNITQVECAVAVNNPVSQAFWVRMGFRRTVERCVLDLG
jgi:GNAT superfamily N-acetyltransferase